MSDTGVTLFSLLPDGVVHRIFRHLNILELYNMRFVDDKCRTVSDDPSLWNKLELQIHKADSGEKVETMLSTMPHLRKLRTEGRHSIPLALLDIILNSVNNLQQLNCKFDPPLRFQNVQRIIEKYKDIESIELDSLDVNIKQSLSLLLTIPTLQKLSLTRKRNEENWTLGQNRIDLFSNVCVLINKFPHLDHLDLSGLYVETDEINNRFVQVISQRNVQLNSFSAAIRNTQALLNAVSQCISLEHLYLKIYYRQQNNTVLDMTDLKTLHTLDLDIQYKGQPSGLDVPFIHFTTQTVNKNFIPNSFRSLTYLKLTVKFPSFDGKTVLSRIVSAAPRLQVLKLKLATFSEVSDELRYLENLRSLEEFSLTTDTALSDVGMELISFCTPIKKLKFNSCVKFTNGTYNRRLERVEELLVMINLLVNMKNLTFKYCKFQMMQNDFKEMLIHFCEQKGVVLKYKEIFE